MKKCISMLICFCMLFSVVSVGILPLRAKAEIFDFDAEITEGETVFANSTYSAPYIIRFVPEENANYIFSTEDVNAIDHIHFELLNNDGEWPIAYSEDYEDGIRLYCSLTAGETYYFRVMTYEWSEPYGSVSVQLAKNPCEHNDLQSEVIPANCTNSGYTEYTCPDCGYKYRADYTGIPGHNDTDGDGLCDLCGMRMYSIAEGQELEITFTDYEGVYILADGDPYTEYDLYVNGDAWRTCMWGGEHDYLMGENETCICTLKKHCEHIYAYSHSDDFYDYYVCSECGNTYKESAISLSEVECITGVYTENLYVGEYLSEFNGNAIDFTVTFTDPEKEPFKGNWFEMNELLGIITGSDLCTFKTFDTEGEFTFTISEDQYGIEISFTYTVSGDYPYIIRTGETKEFTVPAGETVDIQFWSDYYENYTVTAENLSGGAAKLTILDSWKNPCCETEEGASSVAEQNMYFEGNRCYYFRLTGGETDSVYSLTVGYDLPEMYYNAEITEGETTYADTAYGNSYTFKFVPEETEEYIFRTTDEIIYGNYYFELIDGNCNYLAMSDYYENSVRLYCSLTAGETYYFRVMTYEWSEPYGSVSVQLAKNPCEHNDLQSEVIPADCMNSGYTEYTCPDCGYKYRADYTGIPGHNDTDGDGLCDLCGMRMYSIAEGQELEITFTDYEGVYILADGDPYTEYDLYVNGDAWHTCMWGGEYDFVSAENETCICTLKKHCEHIYAYSHSDDIYDYYVCSECGTVRKDIKPSDSTKGSIVLSAEQNESKVTVKMNLVNCIGITGFDFSISFDPSVVQLRKRGLGKDAAELNNKCFGNSFSLLDDEFDPGVVRGGAWFYEYLGTVEDFEYWAYEDISFDPTDFEAVTLVFDIIDPTAETVRFDIESESVGSVSGVELELEETIASKVDSVTAVYNRELTETIDANMETEWFYDEENDASYSEEYKYYNLDEDNLWLTVTFTDPEMETLTGSYYDVCDQLGYTGTLTSDQSYGNEWCVGKHTATFRFLGRDIPVEITIAPDPIETVTARYTKDLYSGIDSYTKEEWIPDEWDYYGHPEEYEYFDLYESDLELTVTFTNGRKPFTGRPYEFSYTTGIYCDHYLDFEQNYDHQLQLGENELSIFFAGRSVPFTVNVCENPIESMTAIYTKTLRDGIDVTTDYDYFGNTYKKFILSEDDFEITLTFNNGMEPFTGTTYELYEKTGWSSRAQIITDEAPENEWGAGQHTATFRFLGRDIPVEITIAPDPIETVTARYPCNLIEDYDGRFRYDFETDEEYFFYKLYENKIVFTVKYTDEEKEDFVGSLEELREELGWFDCSVMTDQYENPWGVGTHTATVSLLGREIEVPVEVIANPVESVSAVYDRPLYIGYDSYDYTDYDGNKYYEYHLDKNHILWTVTYNDGTEPFTGTTEELNQIISADPMILILAEEDNIPGEYEVNVHAFGVDGICTVTTTRMPEISPAELPRVMCEKAYVNIIAGEEVNIPLLSLTDNGYEHTVRYLDTNRLPEGLTVDNDGVLHGKTDEKGYVEIVLKIEWDGIYVRKQFHCELFVCDAENKVNIPDTGVKDMALNTWHNFDDEESDSEWYKFVAATERADIVPSGCDIHKRVSKEAYHSDEFAVELYDANGFRVFHVGGGDGFYGFCYFVNVNPGETYYVNIRKDLISENYYEPDDGKPRYMIDTSIVSENENDSVDVQTEFELIDTNVEKTFEDDETTLWNVYRISGNAEADMLPGDYSYREVNISETVFSPVKLHFADHTLTANVPVLSTYQMTLDFSDPAIAEFFSYKRTSETCPENGETEYFDDFFGFLKITTPVELKMEVGRIIYIPADYELEENDGMLHVVKHIHSYKSVVTPATCTEKGYTTMTCDFCGDSYITDETEKLGHTPAEAVKENEVPATCTADGSYDSVIYCSECHTEISRESKTVTKLGHSFVNYVSDGNATCTADGTKTAKCERCNATDTKTDAGSKLAHTPAEAVKENEVPATCTADGSYDSVIYCSECHTEISRESKTVTKLGHSFVNYVSDGNATCTKDGTKTAKCERCDATETIADEGSKLAHTPAEAVKENEVPATCTADGSYDSVVYCSECHTELSREAKSVEKLGHSFVNYVSDGNATCTADGTKTAKCERCNATDTKTDAGSKLGHDYKATVTAPTCTKDGFTTYTCSRCKDTYTDKLIKAAGHKWNDGTVTKEATTTTAGEKTFTCTVCGEKKSEAIEKLAYIPGDVDGDSKISAADARLALRRSVGLEIYKEGSSEFLACDVDFDGKVTAADARLILRASVGLEDAKTWKKA